MAAVAAVVVAVVVIANLVAIWPARTGTPLVGGGGARGASDSRRPAPRDGLVELTR